MMCPVLNELSLSDPWVAAIKSTFSTLGFRVKSFSFQASASNFFKSRQSIISKSNYHNFVFIYIPWWCMHYAAQMWLNILKSKNIASADAVNLNQMCQILINDIHIVMSIQAMSYNCINHVQSISIAYAFYTLTQNVNTHSHKEI